MAYSGLVLTRSWITSRTPTTSLPARSTLRSHIGWGCDPNLHTGCSINMYLGYMLWHKKNNNKKTPENTVRSIGCLFALIIDLCLSTSLGWYSTLYFEADKPGIQADRLISFLISNIVLGVFNLPLIIGDSQFPVGIGIQWCICIQLGRGLVVPWFGSQNFADKLRSTYAIIVKFIVSQSLTYNTQVV